MQYERFQFAMGYLSHFSFSYKSEYLNELFIFFIQLCFNLLWSIFFFGMKAPLLAFAEILIYIIIVLSMMKIYKNINKLAYFLLFPYLFWILFATYLNFTILLLN